MPPARLRAPIYLALCLVVWLMGTATKARATESGTPRLTWYGQGCFLFETAAGTRIVMDPAPPSAGALFTLSSELPSVDLITISHEHPDHNQILRAAGRTRVMRGLTPDLKGWMKIDEKIKDVSVRTIGVYRDEVRGRERGITAIFVLEAGGLRIAHLGALGHVLDPRALSQLGSVDVVLVPIGGETVLDATRAVRVVDQIRPRLLVIPMHYKPAHSVPTRTDPLSIFIEGRAHVRRANSASVAIKVVKDRPGAEIVILEPRQ